jgi:hypothetical protein
MYIYVYINVWTQKHAKDAHRDIPRHTQVNEGAAPHAANKSDIHQAIPDMHRAIAK